MQRGSGSCAAALKSGNSRPAKGRCRGSPTSGASRPRCSDGASRLRATPGPSRAPYRPSWKFRCLTTARRCAPTSQYANPIRQTARIPWQLVVRVIEPRQDFDDMVARRRWSRSLGERSNGALTPADGSSRGTSLQWSCAARRLGSPRREFRLDGLPRGRDGTYGRSAHLHRPTLAARPAAAPQLAAPSAARGTARGQPQIPERGQRAPGRTGAARPL